MNWKMILHFIFSVLVCSHSASQSFCENSTAQAMLDANNVKAILQASGDIWWDRSNGGYFVPYTPGTQSNVSAIFTGGIWIAGVDPGENLKMAASTYRVSAGESDYWPGPLMPGIGIIDSSTCSSFDRIWKIRRQEINSHIEDFEDNGVIDGPVPFAIMAWPGRNNPQSEAANGFALPDQPLAPFVDRNVNGVYEPLLGDYPDVRGDQALWWVFNDEGGGAIHGETNSVPIRAEIQALAYAYSDPTNYDLYNTTFYEFTLYNRSPEYLDSAFFSLFLDVDLGCFKDDYFGCDSVRNLVYFYNADAIDGDSACQCSGQPTYCEDIPILGVKVLKGPENVNGEDVGFSSLAYFNPMLFPNFGISYTMMTGRWPDGTPFTYGGDGYDPNGQPTNYVFTDSPSLTDGWSMYSGEFQEFDTRVLINSGPFKLEINQKTSITYAVMTMFDVPLPAPDISSLAEMADEVQSFYEMLTDAKEPRPVNGAVQMFPNPVNASTTFVINEPGQVMRQIKIYSSDGKLVRQYDHLNNTTFQMNRDQLPSGIYFYEIIGQYGILGVGKMVLL